ncbi:MAG: hypothetical protein WBA46_11785 [Thermomicrobiales bacterium]
MPARRWAMLVAVVLMVAVAVPAFGVRAGAEEATPEPPPVGGAVAPQVFIDGQATSVTVPLNQTVTVTGAPTGSQIWYWPGTTCTGQELVSPEAAPVFSWNFPTSISVRAVDPADSANVSDCLWIQWVDSGSETPTATVPVVPVVFIDGVSASKTVPLGQAVHLTTSPAGMSIYHWDGPTCGEPVSVFTDPEPTLLNTAPTQISIEAALPADIAIRSTCLTITWQATDVPTATATDVPATVEPTATSTPVTVEPTMTSTPVTVEATMTMTSAPTEPVTPEATATSTGVPVATQPAPTTTPPGAPNAPITQPAGPTVHALPNTGSGGGSHQRDPFAGGLAVLGTIALGCALGVRTRRTRRSHP